MASPALRSPYDREQIDSALLAFAATGENASQACRLLKEQGIEVKPRTLRQWAEERYRDHYLTLCDKFSRDLDRVLVQRTRGIALRASEVERQAVDETEKQLKAGDVKDASAAARNMSVVKGVATDKLLTLTGRPTQIVEHHDFGQLVRKLAKANVVEGTAEEDPAPLPEAA